MNQEKEKKVPVMVWVPAHLNEALLRRQQKAKKTEFTNVSKETLIIRAIAIAAAIWAGETAETVAHEQAD